MVIVIVKHLLTKIIVSVALVRSIVGCGARPVEPATTAQPQAPPAQSAVSAAQTPAAQITERFGGLEYRWSDDINRYLIVLVILPAPGRFISTGIG